MIFKQNQLGSWAAVSVLLGVLVDVSSGMMSIQLIPQYPVIRGSVTLNVAGITEKIQSVIWYKEPNADGDYQILKYLPGDPSPVIYGPLFNSRMTPLLNGSLQISNLNKTDEGNYTVKIQTNQSNSTTINLKIYDTVGKPTITTFTSLPKENDTVTLTCTSTNAEMIVWSRVSFGAILPSGAILSPDNRTVSFSKIKRLDSGDYRCQASNPVSKKTADPITITVAYGPENVKVNHKSSSNSLTLLECFADSIPPATYHWRLNGADIKFQQSELQVDLNKAENEGTYTCVANNSVTRLTAMDSIYVNVTFAFELTDGETSSDNIYGIVIVIAVVLLLVLFAVLDYFFVRPRQHKNKCSTQDKVTMQPNSANNEGPVYENVNAPQSRTSKTALPGTPAQATQESHYEQLTHKDRAIYSTLASKTGKH